MLSGGTFHRFCTGVGKSYALFIQPAGAHTTFFDVEAAAQGCKQYVNLLIDFTRCDERSVSDQAVVEESSRQDQAFQSCSLE